MLRGQDRAFLLFITGIIAFAILLPNIFGGLTSNHKGSMITAMPTLGTATTTLEDRVAALEIQLIASREANDRLYSTVWGTLQTVGAIVAILAVFTWFQNRLSYDRDRRSIENDLQSALMKEVGINKTALSLQNDVLAQDLERKFTELHSEISAKFKELDNLISKRAEDQATWLENRLDKSIKELRLKLHYQQFDVMEMQIEQMKQEGVWENVFTYSLDLLKLAKEMDDDISIITALQYIEEAIARSTKWFPGNLGKVYNLLGSLSHLHSAQVNTIQKLVNEKHEARVRRAVAEDEEKEAATNN
jgi:hypothetical protein